MVVIFVGGTYFYTFIDVFFEFLFFYVSSYSSSTLTYWSGNTTNWWDILQITTQLIISTFLTWFLDSNHLDIIDSLIDMEIGYVPVGHFIYIIHFITCTIWHIIDTWNIQGVWRIHQGVCVFLNILFINIPPSNFNYGHN